tara:strand:+ start:2372 stop:4594 length:2223 start_codon:yes stop_codon:yes gene_type:complete
VKKGDHREYASARAAAKKAEAKALRNEDTDADESAMSEAETRAEETKRERDETEPEPDTEAEAGGDEDDEGGDAKDDEDDEGEVSGSDKFSDRPATSPDRPDGVPKLKIDKKKKGAKDAGKKDAGKKKKKKKSDSDASDTSEADSDAPRTKKAPDLRPPGRKRGETMRKLHKGATRSARGYRSSDGSDVSDGLDRNSENDSEYGGYTERSQFDGKTEYNKLTAAAVNYGKDTSLGKDGMAHKHEDLPIKMAFEHLSSLAGMSAKVQDAIAKSRNLFQRRMQRMDRGVLHKAWRGWLMVQLGFQKKKNVLQRAVRKMKRRKTYNAFHAWWELQNKSKKVGAMGQTARQVVVNGMRRRVFQAWRAKTADKRRQTIMAGHTSSLRDEFSERLVEVGLRQLVHKQMRKAWTGFASYANTCRVARNRARQAITRAQRGCAQRAFSEWQTQTEMAHMQRALCKRAQQRMSLGKVNRAFTEWHKAVAFKNTRVRKILTSQKRRAFAKWNANIHLKHKVARMRVLWGQRNKQAALQGWLSLWSLKQNQIAACEQIHKRTLGRGLRNAWKVWCGVVEEATGCSMEHVRALKDQNARLRRDNERFVRLVDSGEWGRGRVEELTEAGRVLRDERLQLSELIKNIKSEKEGFVKDAMAQAQESRGLKDRLVSGNFVQRNKMTIRGGSSFNTIQRVLKQVRCVCVSPNPASPVCPHPRLTLFYVPPTTRTFWKRARRTATRTRCARTKSTASR